MDFGWTPEQDALRREVCQFIAENLTPEVREEIESRDEGGRGPLPRSLSE